MIPFPAPLSTGTLIQREKRFLAHVRLDTGETIVAHCPNSGAMLGVTTQGQRVALSHSSDPKRKHAFTWELVEDRGVWVGINTQWPNKLVKAALLARVVPALAAYTAVQPEVTVNDSRLDFRLTAEGLPDCTIEVKNAHLVRRNGVLEFPDCVTARGAKHLRALAALKQQGHRAVQLYVGQRGDVTAFAVAADLDPAYAAAANAAFAVGVEKIVLLFAPTLSGFAPVRVLQ